MMSNGKISGLKKAKRHSIMGADFSNMDIRDDLHDYSQVTTYDMDMEHYRETGEIKPITQPKTKPMKSIPIFTKYNRPRKKKG